MDWGYIDANVVSNIRLSVCFIMSARAIIDCNER